MSQFSVFCVQMRLYVLKSYRASGAEGVLIDVPTLNQRVLTTFCRDRFSPCVQVHLAGLIRLITYRSFY